MGGVGQLTTLFVVLILQQQELKRFSHKYGIVAQYERKHLKLQTSFRIFTPRVYGYPVPTINQVS